MFATHPVDGPRAGLFARLRLPSVCAVCRSWGAHRVCAECVGRFAAPRPRCARCALPLASAVGTSPVCGTCIAEPPPFDAALARLDYAYPWDRLITSFKFHGALDLARPFADAVVDARQRSRRDGGAADAGGDAAPRLLVLPVPLSKERLRERGYNQAWQLARRIAGRLGAEADPRLLLRIRDTRHQLELVPEERASNVWGAFAVEPRRLREVRGRAIAVVDDVMTTGHTLAEIARVLKRAGAASVAVWVVARTPRPGEA